MGDEDRAISISKQTLKRLPRYLNYLEQAYKKGEKNISASQISRDLKVQHTQVRKDLAVTGVQGVPKIGHEVKTLIDAIKDFLGWNNRSFAFLIGMGNLGRALAGYEGFKRTGIKTKAAFDIDPAIIGEKYNGVEVLPLEKFSKLVSRMHVKIGILTVPAPFAQETAELMVESGIEAIWNFCPVELKVPDHIIVENTDIYSALGTLSHKLKEKGL